MTVDRIEPTQYDDHAEAFAGLAESASYNALYERPATLELIGDAAGLDVLDIACGPGWHTARLHEQGASVTGCDASPKMIEVAREALPEQVELRVHDCDAPFSWVPDGSLDLVVMALAYHYVNDRAAFLPEIFRMLRPGGHFVISTHHPLDDQRRLGGSYFDTSRVNERWGVGWDIRTWRMPLTEMTEGFAEAGFLIERLIEPRPLPEMAETDHRVFDKLEHAPAFILFRLLKPRA